MLYLSIELGHDYIKRRIFYIFSWFAKYISRKEVDEFRSVVSDGRFDFGVVVGVLEEKISDEAYNSAERSEHDIIVTTYRKMCPKYQELNR